MQNPKHKPLRDPGYIKHLHGERCILTNVASTEYETVDPAHLRFSGSGGTGMKPSDCHALPLIHWLHVKQHSMPEIQFWRENITDEVLADALVALAEKRHRAYQEEQDGS